MKLLHARLPSVAEREGSKSEDVFAGLGPPARPGALHAHANQGLAGGFDSAAPDRQAQAQRPREAHPVGVVLEIGDRFEDRTTRVSPSVIEAGAAQIDEDLFGSAVRATQPLAPPTELELRAIGTEDYFRGWRQLLDHVPEVDALLDLAEHRCGEVGPEQV